jgi:GT2 family glycosyltransferase
VYRIHRRVVGEPLVSIVIPTGGATGAVRGATRTFVVEAIRSIVDRSTYRNIEFVVVADQATPVEVIEMLVSLCGQRLRVVWFDHPFNYSRKVNWGAATAAGDYLILLNDDVEVISPDWIETMLSLAQQPEVGAVGAALVFEDGRLQHGGHFYDRGSPLRHIGYGASPEDPGPVSSFRLERECSGVTAACVMVSRFDYVALGGLAVDLPFNFNDVDLCIKIRTSGKRIVWTPFARLYHFESRTRRAGVGWSEMDLVRRRWGSLLDCADPFWRYPVGLADEESTSEITSRDARPPVASPA